MTDRHVNHYTIETVHAHIEIPRELNIITHIAYFETTVIFKVSRFNSTKFDIDLNYYCYYYYYHYHYYYYYIVILLFSPPWHVCLTNRLPRFDSRGSEILRIGVCSVLCALWQWPWILLITDWGRPVLVNLSSVWSSCLQLPDRHLNQDVVIYVPRGVCSTKRRIKIEK